MSNNQYTGKRGEQIALTYLKDKGYPILVTNWRYKRAEVDIITETKNYLVIVEVKARTSDKYGLPEESVGTRKQEQLIQAAEAYLVDNEIEKEVRFDVIAINLSKSPPEVLHIKDAFFPYQQ